MIENRQIISEEDFIAFIAENMDEFEPEAPEAEFTSSVDDDEDYIEEYATEDDIARENGFWVDEDGDWQPLDEDEYDW